MSLRTALRPTRGTADAAGVDPAHAEHERQVRQARLELARRRAGWTEIPETRLVRRGPFLVDAESDLVFVLRRGHVFEPGKSTVGYVPENTSMIFTVNQDDEVVFLEQPGGIATWSEIVAHKAARR